ncbi:MAG: glycosyltransferase [Anaerolineae bacterium]|jgi:4,4'-diaponeurosporenoate glycosyltransferase
MLILPAAAVLLLLWSLGFYLMWQIPALECDTPGRAPAADEEPYSVSVIIPARDEEQRIRPTLSALRSQAHSPLETIVVDDHSSDDTAHIAGQLGARVIPSLDLPSGWTGKNWACWQGAQAARGDLLLFLDADVRLEQKAIDCLVVTHREDGGLVSVEPYHVTRRPYEELSAFFNLVRMASLNAFVPRGSGIQPAGAYGPCLLCDRDDYFRLGGHGHERVRGAILESIPLSQLFQEHNLLVRCFGGRGLISFRMYPGGLAQLIEGWTKGFGSGALATRLPFFIMTIAWITGCFGAFVNPLRVALLASPGALALLAVYALYTAQIWWMMRRIGSFRPLTALLYPIPLIFFALLMLWSLLTTYVLRSVSWRGRRLDPNQNGSKS